jgi:tetratricopeptide (TPR) repeat protein
MLLDFNLSGDVRYERAGLGGTPTYMAPEQLQRIGRHDGTGLDGRGDLFSLGVILYALLTGRHPFTPPPAGLELQQTRKLLLTQHMAGAVPVRAVNPAVDRALGELIDRCLAFAPADRPASAQAARALLAPAAQPVRRRGTFIGRRGLVLALALPLILSSAARRYAVEPSPPAAPIDWCVRSELACRQGDYADARRDLDEYLRAHPQDARIWLQRGGISLKLKQYDLAVTDFLAAKRLQPDGLSNACLAYALKANGQPKEARYYFAQAIEAGYQSAAVFNDLGYLLLKDVALVEAERHLTQAIRLAPNLQAAYHNRGLVYVKQAIMRPEPAARPARASNRPDEGLLERARSDFTQALAIGPPSGELYLDAARASAYLAASDAVRTAEVVRYLAAGIEHGLDPAALRQRPFPKYLTKDVTYLSLCARTRVQHPDARAQRFVPVWPDRTPSPLGDALTPTSHP